MGENTIYNIYLTAPFIFFILKRKNCTVSKGIHNDFWISKINTSVGIITNHIVEFVGLWARVSEKYLRFT
jgi:hypothetical protein